MKKLILTQRSTSRTLSHILVPSFAAAFLGMSLISTAHAATPLTATMDFGARGNNVTNLQAFLAENPSIYPQGLVTGYYGSLTVQAVRNFQTQYGIVSSGTPGTTGYGRVGPSTLARINQLMATGWGNNPTADMSGPSIYSVAHTDGQTSHTFNWVTNENATARVFYDTAPVQFNEGQDDSSGFGARTGRVASTDSVTRTTHSVTLSGLMPNTLYYYTLVSTDATGNVSVDGPNNTSRTNT